MTEREKLASLLTAQLGDNESFGFGFLNENYTITDEESINEAVASMSDFVVKTLCIPFDPEIMAKAVPYVDPVEETGKWYMIDD